MYAKKKGWALAEIEISLKHQKVHAKDCENCDQPSGYIDVIEKSVTISGELTDQQKSRLVEIAGKCPVHRTLENSVKMRSV